MGDLDTDATTATQAAVTATTATGGDGELTAGAVVGEYTIEARIGKGGFGTVYRGVHPLIGKTVAIKVLSRRYSSDEEMVSRFAAEARAVNQIRHRNIIDIFSFGQLADGRHYYVMEHLDGHPLDAVVDGRGSLPLEEALPILRGVARALGAAHAKGIAHRDLKPENIFLVAEEDGMFPKLLDFGIAKLSGPDDQMSHKTGTGVPLGTPYYMSPEQCRGRDVDHRTDIYSFGILVYRVLTGTYPFEGELIEILHKQMHEDAPPPSTRNGALSPAVDAAIAWMMHKDAAARPQTMAEAIAALAPAGSSGLVTPHSISVQMPPRSGAVSVAHAYTPTLAPGAAAVSAAVSAGHWSGRSPRSRWLLGGGGAALVIGAAAVVAALVLGRRDAPDPPPPARVGSVTPDAAPIAVAAPVPDAAPAASSPSALVDASPALQSTRLVKLANAPARARVFLGTALLGPASAPIALPRSDSDVALRLEAPGYKPGVVIVRPADSRVTVHLEKLDTKTHSSTSGITGHPGTTGTTGDELLEPETFHRR